MKKTFTLILTLLALFVYAQTPITFADPDATWSVAKTFPNGNPQDPRFIETTTKVYGYQGDTLINNELWLKMFVTQDSSFINDLIFVGLINENNGVVSFQDTSNQIDIIYDFNLQVGDSVPYNFYGYATEYLEIIHIDSIEINNSIHKRFFIEESGLEPFHLEEYWIEGIGSIHGPMFSKYPVVFSQELPADSLFTTCYKVANNIVWNNPSYDSCYVHIVMSNTEIYEKDLKMFPNPVKDELRIEIPDKGEQKISLLVYDIHGKVKINRTFEQAGMISINTRSLENGFYMLQVGIGNKKYNQKFIKQ